ncbi:DUF4886 domain-containing protein [Thalassotalea sp. PS06]|uniref:DUF4886 domain-containing protein n=1 Tax=Thalassotalea sp. PS06 TaxID=2594005 RepID=UPI0011643160|nr:DUF4886 domain-containing protein [Thalassotalea sp. PS06]QDP02648.1 hypothetical protein FNC98_15615 [Thalassotalea sp. PS06]
MKLKSNVAIAMLMLLISTSTLATDSKQPQNRDSTAQVVERALFVGNSFSYFNNGIHNHYSSLIKAAGDWQKGEHGNRLLTLSGGRLVEQMDAVSAVLASQGEETFDVVVLQEHSTGAIRQSTQLSFFQSVETLSKQARASGAEPILFMTWAYRNKPNMLSGIVKGYEQAAGVNGLRIAPVGLAFDKVRATYPNINLYVADIIGFDKQGKIRYSENLKHPSLAGTYLAACVFYAVLQGKSPQGLNYNPGLPRADVEKLQAIAWQVVSEFKQVAME